MTAFTILLAICLAVAIFAMYVMYVRIQQLTNELGRLKSRVEIRGDELEALAKDIEEFKRLRIV
jgi:cell division protein FtsL